MRALVTGGGGFLGGAIVRSLLAQGHRVRSFSRGRYLSLQSAGAEQFQGDLADPKAVQEACRDCEIVFHVAAKAGIWGDHDEYYRTNVMGTENMVASCRSLDISRLVFTSSPSVVFDGRDMEDADESVPYPQDYKAPYPATKAAAERMVLAANDERLATVSLRPHLIWGPGDTHLVPGIIDRGRAGKLKKVGKALKLVDCTYIDNAAEAHLLAADRLSPGSRISGRTFFISQGQPLPLWDFINHILAAADLPAVTSTVPTRLAYAVGWLCEVAYGKLPFQGEPPMTRFLAEELGTSHWFDITAARNELSYQPRISTEEGFRRLRAWLKSENQ
ncbi:MAG: NAD-dependent epimerase/dehydratase family protein [Candidatus Binatia bacterium]|nr:NAD-dependent epimerase/dehydratase family protein [Candidatus Binatia bacterium]